MPRSDISVSLDVSNAVEEDSAMIRSFLITPVAFCALAITAFAAAPPSLDVVDKVATQRFDIVGQVDDGGSAVEGVQLWYSVDKGRTWRNYGTTSAGELPIRFTATEEGLYGFYLVATNAAGASGPPPGRITEPHEWVYVDYTPPIVQLHALVLANPQAIPRVVNIHWSVIDQALPARPISLAYRSLPDGPWITIAHPIANTGSYDWRMDDSTTGEVVVRISARDLGGHSVQVVSDPLNVDHPAVPPVARSDRLSVGLVSQTHTTTTVADSAHRRAAELYRKGVLHSMSGEYRLAASRLRDALAADPELTEALVELGRVLYAQGDATNAVEAYKLALTQQPEQRSALEGMAMVFVGQRRFPQAVQQLSRIVRMDPNDVEAWLHLGDIAIYQGDELLAREHYEKAATRAPSNADIVSKANLRLAELRRLAADFRQVNRTQ